jgi:hypothetical protein
VDSRQVIKALKQDDWYEVTQVGSHKILMSRDNRLRPDFFGDGQTLRVGDRLSAWAIAASNRGNRLARRQRTTADSHDPRK